MDALSLAPLAHIPAAYLSAGQKRRLGLARLLVAQRPLWLLDEPTVSLDTASVDLLAAAVTRHLGQGGIAVAATHVDLKIPGAREVRLGLPAEVAA
jgi:heme exporter protein A